MTEQQQAQPQESFSRARRLVALGLDCYGRSEVKEAVKCWRHALELDSSNTEARDYLDAAGFTPDDIPVESIRSIELHAMRSVLPSPPSSGERQRRHARRMTDLKTLLEAKRYEEALEMLLQARRQTPEDPAISKGIRLLKDRLLLDYVRRVGNLEQVPQRVLQTAPECELQASVYRLVDGIASLEDILQASELGRFETYHCLTRMLDSKVIAFGGLREWSLPVPAPVVARPERKRSVASSLHRLAELAGFLGAALVDSESGTVLASVGADGYDIELASALNTEVIRLERETVEAMGLSEPLDDIVITLRGQFHIIRVVKSRPHTCLYLMCNRTTSNLALARMRLAEVDGLVSC